MVVILSGGDIRSEGHMLTTRLLEVSTQLRKIAQTESNTSTVWDGLSEQFRSYLKRSGIKDIEARLKRPANHPKVQYTIGLVKQFINNEIGKIEKNFPGLNEVASKLSNDYAYDDSREWDGGQHFKERSPGLKGKEKVIAIYLSKEKYNEFAADPILQGFLQERSAHFSGVVEPLGWALVYIDPDKKFAAINQIQSDILPKYLKYLKDEKTEAKVLSLSEVEDRLNANNLGTYLDPEVKPLLEKLGFFELLSKKPGLIGELPRIAPSVILERINEGVFTEWLDNNEQERPIDEEDEDPRDPSIAEKLGSLVKEWPDIVYDAVLDVVKKEGIKELYMNTKDTVSGGSHVGKREFMYERKPSEWGFKKKETDVGRGSETLWHKQLARLRRSHRILSMVLMRGSV